MVFQILTSGLGRTSRERAMSEAVNYAQKRIVFPSLKNKGVSIFGDTTVGAGRCAESQLAPDRRWAGLTHPAPAYDVQPAVRTRVKIQLVHQAVNGSEPKTKSPRSGISVRDRLLDIPDARALV